MNELSIRTDTGRSSGLLDNSILQYRILLLQAFGSDDQALELDISEEQLSSNLDSLQQAQHESHWATTIATDVVSHRSEELLESRGKVSFCFASNRHPDFLVIELVTDPGSDQDLIVYAKHPKQGISMGRTGPGNVDWESCTTNGERVSHTFICFPRLNEAVSPVHAWRYNIILVDKTQRESYRLYPREQSFDRHVHFSTPKGAKCAHLNDIHQHSILERYLEVLDGMVEPELSLRWAQLDFFMYWAQEKFLCSFTRSMTIPVERLPEIRSSLATRGECFNSSSTMSRAVAYVFATMVIVTNDCCGDESTVEEVDPASVKVPHTGGTMPSDFSCWGIANMLEMEPRVAVATHCSALMMHKSVLQKESEKLASQSSPRGKESRDLLAICNNDTLWGQQSITANRMPITLDANTMT